MAVKKTSAKKKTAAKKTAAKKTAKKKAASVKKAALKKSVPQFQEAALAPEPKKNRNPLLLLIIMGLVTVIVVLLNRFDFVDNKQQGNRTKKTTLASKNLRSKDRPDKKDSRVSLKDDNKEDIEGKENKKDKKNEKTAATVDVKLYYMKFNDRTEKVYLSSVKRSVNKENLLASTMKALIKGPSGAEENRGLLTAVPSNLRVRSARIRNKVAEIDFNSAIEKGGEGSILLQRIDQIIYTATQFNSVNSVLIKINGKRKRTLGRDGLSIQGPLHRRR